MVSWGSVLQKGAFVLAAIAGIAAVAGAVAPDVAPDAMTMSTMADALDVKRYQDRGTCDFWVVNMSDPSDRIEEDFACSFFWDWSEHGNGTAYVHEALLNLEEDRVFHVPNMARGNMEEWYQVDGHMLTPDALAFQVSPEAGVLMPPPGANGSVTMGWVTSGGQYGGEESLLIGRDLQEVDRVTKAGLEVVHWNSTFEDHRTTWHGYDVYLTEHVDMYSDPKTAWVLEMRRHVLVEMTPRQMAKAFGQPLPGPESLDGEPEPVMELVYQTVPGAVDDHANKSRFFRDLMWPIDNGYDLEHLGAASAGLFAVTGLATRSIRGLGLAKDGDG